MAAPDPAFFEAPIERPATAEPVGRPVSRPRTSGKARDSLRSGTRMVPDRRLAHANDARVGVGPVYPTISDPLRFISAFLVVGDAIAVVVACGLAQLVEQRIDVPPAISPAALLVAVLILAAMRGAGAYSRHLRERLSGQLARAFRNCSAVFALVLALEYATTAPGLFSHTSLSAWYATALLGIGAVRVVAYLQVERWRRRGYLARTVALVDVDGMGHALARQIRRHNGLDLQLVGIFSPHADGNPAIDDLVRVTHMMRVDEIIVAAPRAGDPAVSMVLNQLGAVPTNVHICTSLLQADSPRLEPSVLFGHPVLTLHRRPLDGWESVVKRIEDLGLGILFLLLLLPLMTTIALLIRLDSKGPVLFRQKRLGFNNKTFEIIKFRTMTHVPGPELDVPQARPNDPRVTRIGRFLRRTSLDELPQLFNVLKGDMSLVGPRPHALPHNYQYSSVIEGYWGRHRVRPGITGWAQVNGLRGETDTLDKMQRRVEYDLAYIGNWSLLLDLKVLLMTVIVCLLGHKAY
jgi:Undecaprenyl-phosphate glucose phosphotransferase